MNSSYNSSDLPFDSGCLPFFPEFSIVASPIHLAALSQADLDYMISTCENVITIIKWFKVCLHPIMVTILIFGSIFNTLILAVLTLSCPKTAADIYLISITVGDVTICASSAVNMLLPPGFGGVPVAAAAEVLANLGKNSTNT